MKDKSIVEHNAVRTKMLFRENPKKEELPAPFFSIHKIRELSRLCGSAQQCSGGRLPGGNPRSNLCQGLSERSRDAEPLQHLSPGKAFPKDSSTQLHVGRGKTSFIALPARTGEGNLRAGAASRCPGAGGLQSPGGSRM